jgi:hypothetical protein
MEKKESLIHTGFDSSYLSVRRRTVPTKKVGVTVVLISLFLVVLVYANYPAVHVPEKGLLVIQCTVNSLPTPPDNNIIRINGTIYYTNSSGSCRVKLNSGFYVMTASYQNQSKEQTCTIVENQTVNAEMSWIAPPPPPPTKGILDVVCTVNGQPHVPDNGIITINGQSFFTDPNGHYVAEVNPGSYTVTATYIMATYNQTQTQTAIVTAAHTSHVIFAWITESPPPLQGTLDVQCSVDGIAHAPDNNVVTVNGQNFLTDTSGHYSVLTATGGYTISASYLGTFKTASTTVTADQTSYVLLSWQTPPPPPQGVSTVTTFTGSALYAVINFPMQRKSFYAVSLHWVAYMDQDDDMGGCPIVYKTSSDGVIWSVKRLLYSNPQPNMEYADFFTLHFDGQYLHIANFGWGSVIYRKGIPNADGTITWLAGPQSATTWGGYHDDPTMCLDSNGCPFIGSYWDSDFQGPFVTKSSRNDAIWSEAAGFPLLLSEMHYRGVGVVPLANGQVYAIIFRALEQGWGGCIDMPSDIIYGRLWNGQSWQPIERATTSHIEMSGHHQLAFISDEVDTVYLAFTKEHTANYYAHINYPPYDIICVKRTSAGWGSEFVVAQSPERYTCPALSYDVATNTLYVFWADNTTIYYRKCVSGAWQSTVAWITETPHDSCNVIYPSKIICNENAYGGVIDVAYLFCDTYPYYLIRKAMQIRFSFLTTGGASSNVYSIFGVEVGTNVNAVLLIIAVMAGVLVLGYKKYSYKKYHR